MVQQILGALHQMEKRLTTRMEGGRDKIKQHSNCMLSRCPSFFSFELFKDTPQYDDDDVFDSSTAPEYDDNVFGAHCAHAMRCDAVARDVHPVAVCLAPNNDRYMVQDNTSFSKPGGHLCWVDPLLANQHKKVHDGLIGGTELSRVVRILHCSLLSPNQAVVVESFELESAPPPPIIYDCYVKLGSYNIISSLFRAEVSVDTPTKCSTMGFHDVDNTTVQDLFTTMSWMHAQASCSVQSSSLWCVVGDRPDERLTRREQPGGQLMERDRPQRARAPEVPIHH